MTTPRADTINADLDLISLAREIAMDIQPLETILEQRSISDKTWSKLQKNPRFAQLLANEMEAWQTALNTQERVKIKSASMLEQWLPTLYTRINDMDEALPGVIEAGKMLARLCGIGEKGDVAIAGERFSITINMGPKVVEFTKETPKIVDITPNRDLRFGEDTAPPKKEHATHFLQKNITTNEINPSRSEPRDQRMASGAKQK